MCNFFSAVLTAERAFWLPRSNSHEDIIEAHEIHMDGTHGVNGVRAELYPPKDPATVDNLNAWRYHLDQDLRPEWYNEEDAAKRMRGAASLARSIDPVQWRVVTAASPRVHWTEEQRKTVLGEKRLVLPGINLARAYLDQANLAGANLARANLAWADLAGANLARANLAWANLAGANLARANLARANLAWANLAGANLVGADLAGADLAGANLAGADLAGANLAGAYRLASDPTPAGWRRTVAGALVRDEEEGGGCDD
jgi:hypothetical protein